MRAGAITAFAGVEDAWELREGHLTDNPFRAVVADASGAWRDADAAEPPPAPRRWSWRAPPPRGPRDALTHADRARWAAARFTGFATTSASNVPIIAPWELPSDAFTMQNDAKKDDTWDETATPLLLVIAFNRPRYLAETLRSLGQVSLLRSVRVVVSQDGNDTAVAAVADAFGGVSVTRAGGTPDTDVAALLLPGDAGALGAPFSGGFARWRHPRAAAADARTPSGRPPAAHAALAAHYRWALARAFGDRHNASHVIIAEDDMLFAPDFLRFFAASAPLLAADATLWCASSWNDNGVTPLLADVTALRRTDFFPGLGWMLTAATWQELAPAWPDGNWDHWMRADDVAKGRECVVPQVPRTLNIGRRGANMQAWLYDRRLARMGVAASDVASFGDVSYLLRPRYEARLRQAVAQAVPLDWRAMANIGELVAAARAAAPPGVPPAALLVYNSEQYDRLAALFGAA